jgi:hypothetical protein
MNYRHRFGGFFSSGATSMSLPGQNHRVSGNYFPEKAENPRFFADFTARLWYIWQAVI